LHHRLLQADRGHAHPFAAQWSKFLLERLPGHEINARAQVARTFQNIRLFSGMTVLENLLVAQHNKLMKASGYTILGLLGSPVYRRRRNPSSLRVIG
jgi:branched-chain amino acid transport system ATP-binding protein